jgi:hypothetical protein
MLMQSYIYTTAKSFLFVRDFDQYCNKRLVFFLKKNILKQIYFILFLI